MKITEWTRRPCPETRWTLADCRTRLGTLPGLREWATRQASHWWHRALYAYWQRKKLPPGDSGKADWFQGRVTQHARTYRWERP